MSKQGNEEGSSGEGMAAIESVAKRQEMAEEEVAEGQQQETKSERWILFDESQKLSMKIADSTLTYAQRMFIAKELAAIKWKIKKLDHPSDFIQLRAAREGLIQAELDYIKETEKEDLSKKHADLKESLANAPESLKEELGKALRAFFVTKDEMENSWPKRASDLREQIIKQNPFPWTCPVPMTWAEVSTEVSKAPFAINTLLEDEASQLAVLGPLFKQGTTWPVVQTTSDGLIIDMRFMPHQFFNPDGDVLRPAGRHLSDKVSIAYIGEYVPLGVVGSGKSSALIDVGREHYVIYVQAFSPNDTLEEMPYGSDVNLARMYHDLRARTSLENTNQSVWINDDILDLRAEVELLARILQLVRLYREVGTSLTPWMFTVHQLACSDQHFVKEMVDYLGNCDFRSIESILEEAMKELAPIFSENRKFVLSIDDMEFSMDLLKERFKPPSDSEGQYPRSLLSGIRRAAGHFDCHTKWTLLISGTGLPVNDLPRGLRGIRSSIGKFQDDLSVSGLSLFPVCRKENIVRMLSCLNISEELRNLVENMSTSAWPLHLPPRKASSSSTQESIKDLLEEYMVSARFGLLCGIIEVVKDCLEDHPESDPAGTKTPDEILRMSIEETVALYREFLAGNLSTLLNSDYVYKLDEKESNDYLRNLLSVAVVMRLTDGQAHVVREIKPKILPWIDLVRWGIAIQAEEAIFEESFTKLMAYTCHERIAVEAIENMFSTSEQVLNRPESAYYRRTFDMLSTFLDEFAKKEPMIFKGSIINKIIFNRLVHLQRECPTLGDLPFFPENIDPSWKSIPFKAQAIKQADELGSSSSISTPDFLISPDAENVIYVPERSCRPGGIIMLPKTEGQTRRAISLGIALDSHRVLEEDLKSLNLSTDLTRSYLDQERNQVDPATQPMRERWWANKLHETVTLRILIHLPVTRSPRAIVYLREKNVSGGSQIKPIQTYGVDDDVIVSLDCSNIHLLLGQMDETNQVLYELLKIATDLKDGWCVNNSPHVSWGED